mmetsp:Transcript_22707/g.31680  ORF Transcript_22707/g.31680 Transcript_22707/m.31680 type:complete len:105 (-) Transcript_22707:105-419(-)
MASFRTLLVVSSMNTMQPKLQRMLLHILRSLRLLSQYLLKLTLPCSRGRLRTFKRNWVSSKCGKCLKFSFKLQLFEDEAKIHSEKVVLKYSLSHFKVYDMILIK